MHQQPALHTRPQISSRGIGLFLEPVEMSLDAQVGRARRQVSRTDPPLVWFRDIRPGPVGVVVVDFHPLAVGKMSRYLVRGARSRTHTQTGASGHPLVLGLRVRRVGRDDGRGSVITRGWSTCLRRRNARRQVARGR